MEPAVFWKAVANGDIALLRSFLQNGGPVDAVDEQGRTMLHVAAENRQLRVLGLLLEHGACVQVKNAKRQDCLMLAALHGADETLEFLLGKNIYEPTAVDVDGNTALMLSISSAATSAGFKLLLTQDADMQQSNNENETLAIAAVRNNRPDLLKDVLELGCQPNTPRKDGETPLLLAAKLSMGTCADILLSAGAEPERCNSYGESPFMVASQNGNVGVAETLYRTCDSLGAKNMEGNTALSLAAINGHLEMLQWLIHRNACLDVPNAVGETALMLAVRHGRLKAVATLLHAGSSVWACNFEGLNVLMIAALEDQQTVLRYIIEFVQSTFSQESEMNEEPGPSPAGKLRLEGLKHSQFVQYKTFVDLQNEAGETALMCACKCKHTECLKILVKTHASTSICNNYGASALHLLAAANSPEGIALLIADGVEINSAANDGNTALITAAWKNNHASVEAILNFGGDANHQNKNGCTALMVSAWRNNTECVQLLIQCMAMQEAKNSLGQTALMLAASKCHIESVKILIRHIYRHEAVDNRGYNALGYAVLGNFPELVRIFLKSKGGVEEPTGLRGETALTIAAEHGYADIIEMLLDSWFSGARLEHTDCDGNSALSVACKFGNLECVKHLIEAGANVNVANITGLVPLMLAAECHNVGIAKLLLASNADTSLVTCNGCNSFMIAAKAGCVEVLELLYGDGSSLVWVNLQGHSALHLACKFNHMESVKFLLDKGANIMTTNLDGDNCVTIAVEEGNKEIAEYLTARMKKKDVVMEWNFDIMLKEARVIEPEFTVSLRPALPINLRIGTAIKESDAVDDESDEQDAHVNARRSTLLQSIIDENVEGCRSILSDSDKSADFVNTGNFTPLHVAAFFDTHVIVPDILKAGVGIDVRGDKNLTPLMVAVERGSLSSVKELLKAGARNDLLDDDGCTSLMLGSINGQKETIKFLCESQFPMDVQNNEGLSAMMFAAYKGHAECVGCLLSNGADSALRNLHGYTALMLGIIEGHLGVISAFLMFGVPLNDTFTMYGGTPLLGIAAWNDHDQAVKLLIGGGCRADLTNKLGCSALHVAAMWENISSVQEFLNSGVDINSSTKDGLTSLMIASYFNLISMMTKLVNAGADVSCKDSNGSNALTVAVWKGNKDACTFLLENNAQISSKNIQGDTPLHIAAAMGHFEILSLLLEKGADGNCPNKMGETPLHIAMSSGHLDCFDALYADSVLSKTELQGTCLMIYAAESGLEKHVLMMLESSANIEATNKEGHTALCVSIVQGYQSCVTLLLDAGSNVEHRDKQGRTPLMLAVEHGHPAIAASIIKHGYEVNAEDGSALLAFALKSKCKETVCAVLEVEGLDVNKSCGGDTPLMMVASMGDATILECLFEAGASFRPPHSRGNHGKTLAIHTVLGGSLECLNAIVEAGGASLDLDIPDDEGETPLQKAIHAGRTDMVEVLIAGGASADLRQRSNNPLLSGDTPIISAARSGMPEVLLLLLNGKRGINTRNLSGKHALIVASECNSMTCVEILLENDADVNVTDCQGQNALMYASFNGNIPMCKTLVEHGADIQVSNMDGWNPAMCAVSKGRAHVVEFLMCNGVDITAKDKHFRDIFQLALDNGHIDCQERLAKHHNKSMTKNPGSILSYDYVKSVLPCMRDFGTEIATTLYSWHQGLLNEITEMQEKNKAKEDGTKEILDREQAEYEQQCLEYDEKLQLYNENKGAREERRKEREDAHHQRLQRRKAEMREKVKHKKEDADDVRSQNGESEQVSVPNSPQPSDDEDGGDCDATIEESDDEDVKMPREVSEPVAPEVAVLEVDLVSKFLLAAWDGDCALLQRYYDSDVSIISAGERDGMTALMLAAWKDNADALKWLLQQGADSLSSNKRGWSGLLLAAVAGNVDSVKLILERGGIRTVENRDRDGMTALMASSALGHACVAKVLVKNGASGHLRNRFGLTPFMLATINGHCRTLADIVKSPSANRETESRLASSHQFSCLMIAAMCGFADDCEYLHEEFGPLNKVKDVNRDGMSAFLLSILEGHTGVVSILYGLGANLGQKDHEGNTALHIAAVRGHTEILSLLIDLGVEINEKNVNGATALMLACWEERSDVITILLEKDADILVQNQEGHNALMLAAARPSLAVMRALLEREPGSIDETNAVGSTALHLAAKSGSSETVNFLIDHGASLTHLDNNGMNVLHIAAYRGFHSLVWLLRERGFDATLTSNDGTNALMYASMKGHVNCVEELCRMQVGVNHRNANRDTAVSLAAKGGHFEVVQLLTKFDASPDPALKYNCTPLMAACGRDDIAMAAALIELGAEVNHINVNCQNSMFMGIRHPDILKLLLKNGTDSMVHQRDVMGNSAVHFASTIEDVQLAAECTSLLYQAGADLNARNKSGDTPLHLAVNKCLDANVSMLLQLDPSDWSGFRDHLGRNALHVASILGYVSVAKELLAKSPSAAVACSSVSLGKRTALALAARAGHPEMCIVLVGAGAKVDVVDAQFSTPLIIAAACGHSETVFALLKLGANPDLINESGQTAVQVAEHFRQFQAAKVLKAGGRELLRKAFPLEPSEFPRWVYELCDVSREELKRLQNLVVEDIDPRHKLSSSPVKVKTYKGDLKFDVPMGPKLLQKDMRNIGPYSPSLMFQRAAPPKMRFLEQAETSMLSFTLDDIKNMVESPKKSSKQAPRTSPSKSKNARRGSPKKQVLGQWKSKGASALDP